MSNYSAKILNNARTALAAQQAVIANIGNNIANVNTPGYSRRTVNLETNYGTASGGGLQIGNGVRIGSISRITDAFVEKLLRGSLGERASAQIQNDFLKRVENLFSLTGDRQTIGSTLSDFYTALNDLSVNPASIELRTNVLERTQDLISTIRETYNTIANLQTEADQRLAVELQTVNALTSQIAELNMAIKSREAGSNGEVVAADERDARERLLNDLAEKISFNRVDVGDGTVSLFLSNGLPLVVGNTARALSATIDPSFNPAPPPSLSGGVLSYIVTDYGDSGGPAHVDLTSALASGEGSIAGLLALRGVVSATDTNAFQANGTLVELASRVEGITRSLLTDFNALYRGNDRSAAAGFQPDAGGLDGQIPDVFGLFDFDLIAGAKDADGDGVAQDSDLNAHIDSGLVTSFSSILQLRFTDPREFAAARDSTPANATPTFAQGDNRNIQALLDARTTARDLSVGNFSLMASYDQAYVESVTYVGNASSAASLALSVAKDNVVAAENKRGEVSGVSLDEEFTALIQFQKAYQASARMIRVADELLTEILQLI